MFGSPRRRRGLCHCGGDKIGGQTRSHLTSFPGHSPSVLRLPAYLQAVYAPGAGAEGHPPNLRFSPHLVVPPKRALALLMGRAHGPPFPLRCMGLYAASALSHTPVHYRPFGLRCKEKLTEELGPSLSRRQPGRCFCMSGLLLTSVTDGSRKAWRGQSQREKVL